MPLYINAVSIRPNRLTSIKDRKYHSDYARWTLQALNHPLYMKFVGKTMINWSFYKGNDGQWIFEEDLEAFFMDETGNTKNRIKMAYNLIKPMVEQFKGNAIRLAFNARAEAVSDFAVNRREMELSRLLYFDRASRSIPDLSEVIKDRFPIGKTPMETEEIFRNSWVDTHEDDINNLLKAVERDINIQEIKIQLATQLAISGIAVYKGYPQNGRYLGTTVDPMFYFFDLSAKKPDLSDAEYMGEWYYQDAPTLFERFQDLTDKERQAIEGYSRNQSIEIHRMVNDYYNITGDKIPVYEVYWKDMEHQEYGYVMDPFGYPFFTRINHPDCDYTDKDLIDPPDEAHAKILNGKKKEKIYVDILRYCIFIPKEEIGNVDEDILLEWGEVPYQEKYAIDPSSVQFPYKVYAWNYDKGEIISPLDDAIQPQRFINRLLSVAESHINNSRGVGTVISKDAVDSRDGEEGIMRNINSSKPIFVDTTRLGSVANAVGQYGSTIDQGTLGLFEIIAQLRGAMQNITGINDAMTGTQGGSDSLVGVIQSQIQRGSLQQEPFYYALASILQQAYQHIASVGKKVYADNPRRLAMMTGDRSMQNIIITKDAELEDFRVSIKRVESDESAVQNGNTLLFTLLQAGLIDAPRFANLFDRATPHEIAKKLREYQAELQQAAMMKDDVDAQNATMQQQQLAAMAQKIQQQQQQEIDRESYERQADRDSRFNEILLKEGAKNERERTKLIADGKPVPSRDL